MSSSSSTTATSPRRDPREAVRNLPEERMTQFVYSFIEAAEFVENAASFSLEKCLEAQLDNPHHDCLDCVHNINACASLVFALPVLSDMMLPVDGRVFQMLPGSPMSFHITWNALEDDDPQVLDLEPAHFIILIADVIGLYMCRKDMLGQARRIVHELEAQIEGGFIDFDEIENDDGLYNSMQEHDITYAVATLGFKINRLLYRRPSNEREHLTIPPPTDSQLLADCRRFARRQNEEKPESPMGSMNLGWVELECQKVALAHSWFETSVKRADTAENDLVECTARIAQALTTIMGSGRYAPGMQIQRKQVQELYDGFVEGCQGLEDWHMEGYAHQEAIGESLVTAYLKRYTTEMTPAVDPQSLFMRPNPGRKPNTRMCNGCGKYFAKVKKCAGCKRTAYCSRACHVRHWKAGHKEECDYGKRKTAPVMTKQNGNG